MKLTIGSIGVFETQRRMNLVEGKLGESPHGEVRVINDLEINVISNETLPTADAEIRRSIKELKLDIADDARRKVQSENTSVLVGSIYYWEIITGNVTKLCNKVTLAKTVFGWTVQESSKIEEKLTTCSAISIRYAA